MGDVPLTPTQKAAAMAKLISEQPAPSEGLREPSHPSPGESAGFDALVERLAAAIHEYGGMCRSTYGKRSCMTRDHRIMAEGIAAALAEQPASSEGLRKPTEDYSPDYSQSFDSAIEWPTTRRLYLEGKTVISQSPTDPGDIGEPRISTMDDTTYVTVPEFELWPTDPDWEPHDASIVYVTRRSFTLNAPGRMTYHRPSRHSRYSDRTGCGIEIWSSGWEPGQQSSLIAVRRDVASRIARPCSKCGTDR